MHCVQYTFCKPYEVLFSALQALFSIYRLYAVQNTTQCTTCIVFNTPSERRKAYYSVQKMFCLQHTVCRPYTVLLSALHAMCKIHRLYALHSTAKCTICIMFNTPSGCRTHYCLVHYMQCVQYTVCMP